MPRRPSLHAVFLSVFVLLAATSGAIAQSVQAPAPANEGARTQPAQQPPAANGAPAATPLPDTEAKARQAELAARVTERANRELGLNLNETLSRWQRDIDRVSETLSAANIGYSQLTTSRDELERLRENVDSFLTTLEPRLEGVNTLAAKLGPAPAQGDAPEPEEAARTRGEISGLRSTYASAKSVAEQTSVRAAQLISQIQDIRRSRFASRLFNRAPDVLDLDLWRDFPENFAGMVAAGGSAVADWWRSLGMQGGRDAQAEALQLIALAIVLCLIFLLLTRRGVAHLRSWPDGDVPPFWKRAGSAAGVIALRTLPVAVPVVFLYSSLKVSELIDGRIDWVFYTAARAVIVVSAVHALIKTVVAPRNPQWRLIALSDAAAFRVHMLVVALAAVYALNLVTNVLTIVARAPLSLTVAQSFLASLVISGLLIAILRTRGDAEPIEGTSKAAWLPTLQLPLWILTLAILATAFAGYVALSRFIATQVIVTGTIFALVYLLMIWVDAFGQSMRDEESRTGRWLQSSVGFDAKRRGQLALPVTLFLKFLVLLFSAPLIMLQWGPNWEDVTDWFGQLFFGFQVGNTHVSVAAIIAAVIVFILGSVGAKVFQGWLDNQILKPAGLSGSLRDSIRTGVGYLGISAAALIAFSYAGLDLSNLAIVAGAFSVGIGFGLQSIVSNFISGLILLAERPIKVGDWVVVGGEEGYVRKISVRSTEIETFDRANVLVPNSNFITETVKNWTLHNNMGRLSIPVSVEYGSDPRQVKELLLKVARDHLNVMTNPEPFVYFANFGADGLDFVLYFYVFDLGKGLGTRTDIRIAIVEEFQKANIDIPYRKADVMLKDMEWLKEAVTLYMSRAGGAPSQLSQPPQKNGPIMMSHGKPAEEGSGTGG